MDMAAGFQPEFRSKRLCKASLQQIAVPAADRWFVRISFNTPKPSRLFL